MNLETIISELKKAENDNKKFALLLILSQLLKTNKISELEEKQEELLFYAIDPHFMARLIVSVQVPPDCSKSIFKSVAMSILVKFKHCDKLACDPILLSKIKTIVGILKVSMENVLTLAEGEELNLERSLLEDTFSYLFALSSYCSNHLCKNGLLGVLLNDFIFNEKLEEGKHDWVSISVQLLGKLCEHDAGKLNLESKVDIFDSLEGILQTLASNQQEFKFKLINVFNELLKQPGVDMYMALLLKERPNLMKTTVFNIFNDLFKSKNLKPAVKAVVFTFLSYFVQNFDDFLDDLYTNQKELFYLIAHLVSVEIRLCLEDTSRSFSDLAANKEEFLDRISIYFTIFEKFIVFISVSPLMNIEVDGAQIDNLLKLTIETIQSILSFLKDNLTAREYETLDESIKLNAYFILVSSIRVVACWFAYEELLEYEIIDLMSEITHFSTHFKSTDVHKFIRPGLTRFIENNEESVTQMLKNETKHEEYDSDLIEKYTSVKTILQQL